MMQEAAIAAVLLWGLGYFGIYTSPPVLAGILVVWTTLATLFYLKGSAALRRTPLAGLTNMVGMKGTAITTINSKSGLVKIQSEIWNARSHADKIEVGETVIVIRQHKLELDVEKSEE